MHRRHIYLIIGIVMLFVCASIPVVLIKDAFSSDDSFRVQISEERVSIPILDILFQNANPLLTNPQVDLQSGFILNPGSILVSGDNGSLRLIVGTDSFALSVIGAELNIRGVSANDRRLGELKQGLVNALYEIVSEDDEGIFVQSVSISDTEIVITALSGKSTVSTTPPEH